MVNVLIFESYFESHNSRTDLHSSDFKLLHLVENPNYQAITLDGAHTTYKLTLQHF